jgi:imidazolonepropionase-like amidohydrolase
LPVLVANGVTGVRDMGGRLTEIDEWRTRIAAGILTGPHIVRAGPILNGKRFNDLQMVPGGPDETRGVARALKEVGVDFLKVHRRLPKASYLALLDEGRKQGLVVVGHIPMTVTPEEASDAGQATVEHTETLFEGTFSVFLKPGDLPAAIRRFRGEEADKLFARFVKNGTFVTPTLVAYRSLFESAEPSATPDPRRRYVALSLLRAAAQSRPLSAADLREAKETFVELREVTGQMDRQGVQLLAGTDIAGPRIPGFTLHDELALLVETGLTPVRALRAATRTPARVLKLENDYGSVDVGKKADLVLLDANPLDDIHNTRRIAAVILRGKLLNRSDLDDLLARGEELAKTM